MSGSNYFFSKAMQYVSSTNIKHHTEAIQVVESGCLLRAITHLFISEIFF